MKLQAGAGRAGSHQTPEGSGRCYPYPTGCANGYRQPRVGGTFRDIEENAPPCAPANRRSIIEP